MLWITAFTTLIVTIASWNVITVRVGQYLASFMFLSGLMIGTFASLDGMLFFVFFEATLIPMYLLIGSWGGSGRVVAAVKFFFFSLIGFVLLVAYVALAAGGGEQRPGPADQEGCHQRRDREQLGPHRKLGEPHGGDQAEAERDSVQRGRLEATRRRPPGYVPGGRVRDELGDDAIAVRSGVEHPDRGAAAG